MSLLDRALAAIRTRRVQAHNLGFTLVGVVGSVARGEEGPDSDVDIAYDVIGRASLLGLARLHIDLVDDLSRPVDLVDMSRVRPRMARELERDLIRA